MFKFLPMLGFFSAFVGPLGMVSYLCVLKIFRVKFGLFDSLFILFLISTLLMNLFIFDVKLVITTFRFYFGFICFYIYFKSDGGFPIKAIVLFLLFLIPLEAFLINTIIAPQSMPNFPSENAYSHFSSSGYQRPYSFAGNASVSSAVLVIMLSVFLASNYIKAGVSGCVILFSSGSGFMSLIFLFLLKNFKTIVKFSFVFVPLLIVFYLDIIDYIDGLNAKINSKYILYLIEFKAEQITILFEGYSILDLFFGKLDSLSDSYGGDFGWLYFILGYGFGSTIILISFILSKVTRETFVPIIISLFATLHYPVIFFLPGQIILGYLMAMKYRPTTC